MEPITMAIVAALTAGVTSGMTETAKESVADAYQSLKSLIRKKFGNESHVIKSIEILESKPGAINRQQTLDEEIIDAQVANDQEIWQVAQAILDMIKAQPAGERLVQMVTGNYNAVVQGSGNATVNVNQPDLP